LSLHILHGWTLITTRTFGYTFTFCGSHAFWLLWLPWFGCLGWLRCAVRTLPFVAARTHCAPGLPVCRCLPRLPLRIRRSTTDFGFTHTRAFVTVTFYHHAPPLHTCHTFCGSPPYLPLLQFWFTLRFTRLRRFCRSVHRTGSRFLPLHTIRITPVTVTVGFTHRIYRYWLRLDSAGCRTTTTFARTVLPFTFGFCLRITPAFQFYAFYRFTRFLLLRHVPHHCWLVTAVHARFVCVCGCLHIYMVLPLPFAHRSLPLVLRLRFAFAHYARVRRSVATRFLPARFAWTHYRLRLIPFTPLRLRTHTRCTRTRFGLPPLRTTHRTHRTCYGYLVGSTTHTAHAVTFAVAHLLPLPHAHTRCTLRLVRWFTHLLRAAFCSSPRYAVHTTRFTLRSAAHTFPVPPHYCPHARLHYARLRAVHAPTSCARTTLPHLHGYLTAVRLQFWLVLYWTRVLTVWLRCTHALRTVVVVTCVPGSAAHRTRIPSARCNIPFTLRALHTRCRLPPGSARITRLCGLRIQVAPHLRFTFGYYWFIRYTVLTRVLATLVRTPAFAAVPFTHTAVARYCVPACALVMPTRSSVTVTFAVTGWLPPPAFAVPHTGYGCYRLRVPRLTTRTFYARTAVWFCTARIRTHAAHRYSHLTYGCITVHWLVLRCAHRARFTAHATVTAWITRSRFTAGSTHAVLRVFAHAFTPPAHRCLLRLFCLPLVVAGLHLGSPLRLLHGYCTFIHTHHRGSVIYGYAPTTYCCTPWFTRFTAHRLHGWFTLHYVLPALIRLRSTCGSFGSAFTFYCRSCGCSSRLPVAVYRVLRFTRLHTAVLHYHVAGLLPPLYAITVCARLVHLLPAVKFPVGLVWFCGYHTYTWLLHAFCGSLRLHYAHAPHTRTRCVPCGYALRTHAHTVLRTFWFTHAFTLRLLRLVRFLLPLVAGWFTYTRVCGWFPTVGLRSAVAGWLPRLPTLHAVTFTTPVTVPCYTAVYACRTLFGLQLHTQFAVDSRLHTARSHTVPAFAGWFVHHTLCGSRLPVTGYVLPLCHLVWLVTHGYTAGSLHTHAYRFARLRTVPVTVLVTGCYTHARTFTVVALRFYVVTGYTVRLRLRLLHVAGYRTHARYGSAPCRTPFWFSSRTTRTPLSRTVPVRFVVVHTTFALRLPAHARYTAVVPIGYNTRTGYCYLDSTFYVLRCYWLHTCLRLVWLRFTFTAPCVGSSVRTTVTRLRGFSCGWWMRTCVWLLHGYTPHAAHAVRFLRFALRTHVCGWLGYTHTRTFVAVHGLRARRSPFCAVTHCRLYVLRLPFCTPRSAFCSVYHAPCTVPRCRSWFTRYRSAGYTGLRLRTVGLLYRTTTHLPLRTRFGCLYTAARLHHAPAVLRTPPHTRRVAVLHYRLPLPRFVYVALRCVTHRLPRTVGWFAGLRFGLPFVTRFTTTYTPHTFCRFCTTHCVHTVTPLPLPHRFTCCTLPGSATHTAPPHCYVTHLHHSSTTTRWLRFLHRLHARCCWFTAILRGYRAVYTRTIYLLPHTPTRLDSHGLRFCGAVGFCVCGLLPRFYRLYGLLPPLFYTDFGLPFTTHRLHTRTRSPRYAFTAFTPHTTHRVPRYVPGSLPHGWFTVTHTDVYTVIRFCYVYVTTTTRLRSRLVTVGWLDSTAILVAFYTAVTRLLHARFTTLRLPVALQVVPRLRYGWFTRLHVRLLVTFVTHTVGSLPHGWLFAVRLVGYLLRSLRYVLHVTVPFTHVTHTVTLPHTTRLFTFYVYVLYTRYTRLRSVVIYITVTLILRLRC